MRSSARRVVVLVLVAVVLLAIAGCSKPKRGDPCRTDDDCAKGGLECVEISSAGNAFCSTRCTLDVPGSCPAGWKCKELDHWTQATGCVRE